MNAPMRGLPAPTPPTAEDYAEATAFFDRNHANSCPVYVRNNRARMIESNAWSFKQARERREYRERRAAVVMMKTSERKVA